MLAFFAVAALAASTPDATSVDHAQNFKPATYYQCLARSSEHVDVLDDGNMAERACLKGCDVQFQKNGMGKSADGHDAIQYRGHFTGTPCSVPMVIPAPAAAAATTTTPITAVPSPPATASVAAAQPSAAASATSAVITSSAPGAASFDHTKNFTAATYYKCLAKSSDQINVRSDGIGDLHEMACIDGCDVAYQKLGPTKTADGKDGVMYRGHFPGTPCSVPLVVPAPAAAVTTPVAAPPVPSAVLPAESASPPLPQAVPAIPANPAAVVPAISGP